MLINRLSRRIATLSLPAILVLTGMALALLMLYHSAPAYAAPTSLNVGAGVGGGTVAGNVYTPGDITVETGSTVNWTIKTGEPHTITFGSGPAGNPGDWPVAGFTAPPPGPPGPVALGSTDYAGTGFVNTGVIFQGSTASVKFTTAGNFPFSCAIHPGMAGTVHVVAAGADTTTQAEADAAATQTTNLILGQVNPLEAGLAAKAHGTTRADGTTLWDIYANAANPPAPMPGGGTGYLELLRYVPANVAIGAGDTVRWTATYPHTVTFLASGQDPSTLGDPFAVPAAKPSQNYDGTSFYNSAMLALGPGAPATFDLTFPKAGTYNYLCLLHGSLGQVGKITVGAAGTGGVPVKLPSTGGSPGDSGTSPLLPLAGGALLMLIAAAAVTRWRWTSSD